MKLLPAKGGFGAELLEYQLLDGIVEDAVAHADAGFPWTANQFPEPTIVFTRTPIQAKARSEAFPVGLRQRQGHVFVAGKQDQTGWEVTFRQRRKHWRRHQM